MGSKLTFKRRIKNSFFIRGVYKLLLSYRHYFLNRRSFAQCDKSAIISPPYYFNNPTNVSFGPNTCLGPNSFISTINAKFICLGNCAIAEGLTVHTGNHARLIGKYVTQISEQNKPKGYDADVVVEQDVWIGSNVTLLSGTRIGRGATIAAGAVVSKSIPPYSVCGGVPAKFIKFYWTIEQILEHEQKVYAEEDRLPREYLQDLYHSYDQ